MTKRFNVVTKKTYTKNGVENSSWNNVGSLVAFDDGYALELSMFPDTKFYVFEQKDKNSPKKPVTNPVEDLSPEEINF